MNPCMHYQFHALTEVFLCKWAYVCALKFGRVDMQKIQCFFQMPPADNYDTSVKHLLYIRY